MKDPHCKICGHDHSGPCTEFPECRKAGSAGYSKNPPKMDQVDYRNPLDVPESPVQSPRGSQQDLSDRVEAIENRLDVIDSRRKYQRHYMRKKRGKK